MSGNPLRLATAKAIQQYRLTKLLPIYSDSELRDVVDAWMPIIEGAGITPQYLPDLFVFALARRDINRPFGAEDLARNWESFIQRKKMAALYDYNRAMDEGADPDEAWRTYTKRCAEMGTQ